MRGQDDLQAGQSEIKDNQEKILEKLSHMENTLDKDESGTCIICGTVDSVFPYPLDVKVTSPKIREKTYFQI